MKIILLVMVIFNSNISYASDLYSKSYDQCLDKANGSDIAMIDCEQLEYEYQDKKLNELYKKVIQSLPEEKKKSFKEAQKAWINYKEKNCSFYYDENGGTMGKLSGNNCFTTITAGRVKELEMILHSY